MGFGAPFVGCFFAGPSLRTILGKPDCSSHMLWGLLIMLTVPLGCSISGVAAFTNGWVKKAGPKQVLGSSLKASSIFGAALFVLSILTYM